MSNINTHDDLTSSIHKVLSLHNVNLPKWYISGILGLGSRITLSMNVKSGKEIGHQSSKYIWDVIAFVENCFIDIGIKLRLYAGQGYMSSARRTSAQTSRDISDNIIPIEGNDLQLTSLDPLIIASSDGSWNVIIPEQETYYLESDNMPFGVIVIQIYEITQKIVQPLFPKNTLKYIISTLERGEEPMEVPGIGHYSAVSGWKAYARWMQAYSVPMQGVKSDYITKIPLLVLNRRIAYSEYWKYLMENLEDETEKLFASKLYLVYNDVTIMLRIMIDDKITYNAIKQIYFKEQESLPVYKLINKYIKNS